MATRREEVDDKLKGAIQREARVQNAPAFTSGTSQGPLVNQTTLQALNTVSNFTTGAAKNYINTKNKEALLRGQISARQGQSLESLKLDEGANKYALEGWRVMSANTSISSLVAELDVELQQKDYEMSSEDYASYLTKKISKLSEDEYGYPIDPRLSQMMNEGMNKLLPGLVEKHTQLHVDYNRGITKGNFTSAVTSLLGSGPVSEELVNEGLANIIKTGSLLSKKEQNNSIKESIFNSLLNGSPDVWRNLKQFNKVNDLNLTSSELQSIKEQYKAQQARAYSDAGIDFYQKEQAILTSGETGRKTAEDISNELEEHYSKHSLDYDVLFNERAIAIKGISDEAAVSKMDVATVQNAMITGNDFALSDTLAYQLNMPKDKLESIADGTSGINVKFHAGPGKEDQNKQVLYASILSKNYSPEDINKFLESTSPFPFDTGKKTSEGRTIWSKNGEVFSEKTITKEINGSWYNIPTVDSSGRTLSDGDALRAATSQGENVVDTITGTTLKAYKDVTAAVKAAEARSNSMPKVNVDNSKDEEMFEFINTRFNNISGFSEPTNAQVTEALNENTKTTSDALTASSNVRFDTNMQASRTLLEQGLITPEEHREDYIKYSSIKHLDLTEDRSKYLSNSLDIVSKQEFSTYKKEQLQNINTRMEILDRRQNAIRANMFANGNIPTARELKSWSKSYTSQIDKILDESGLHRKHLDTLKSYHASRINTALAIDTKSNREYRLATELHSLGLTGTTTGNLDNVKILDSDFAKEAELNGYPSAIQKFNGYFPESVDFSKDFNGIINLANAGTLSKDDPSFQYMEGIVRQFQQVRLTTPGLADDFFKDTNARLHASAIATFMSDTNATFEQAFNRVVKAYSLKSPEEIKATESRIDKIADEYLTRGTYDSVSKLAKKAFDDLTNKDYAPIGLLENIEALTLEAVGSYVALYPGANDKAIFDLAENFISKQTAKVGEGIIVNDGIQDGSLSNQFFGALQGYREGEIGYTNSTIGIAVHSYILDRMTSDKPEDREFKLFIDKSGKWEATLPGNLGMKGNDNWIDIISQGIRGTRKYNAVLKEGMLTLTVNPAYSSTLTPETDLGSLFITVPAREIGGAWHSKRTLRTIGLATGAYDREQYGKAFETLGTTPKF